MLDHFVMDPNLVTLLHKSSITKSKAIFTYDTGI